MDGLEFKESKPLQMKKKMAWLNNKMGMGIKNLMGNANAKQK